MKLFDDIERDDEGLKSYSEAAFSYLNRSASAICRETRWVLESWFERFPEPGRKDLRQRFRSKSDIQHWAAYYELLVHEFLVCLGAKVEAHPVLARTERKPDFLATWPDGRHCYVEATVAAGELGSQASAQAIKDSIVDDLDTNVVADNFSLWMDIQGAPSQRHSIKKVVRFLNERLGELDPDEMATIYERSGFDGLPVWRFELDGWILQFRPIPKKSSARKSGGKRVGVQMGEFGVVDHRTPLRDAMLDKAGAYSELDAPYVIVVNGLDSIDRIDVEEALFGREEWTVFTSHDPSKEKVVASRQPGGLWTGSGTPRYTRVSGVLVTKKLLPLSVTSPEFSVLYHNPWATNPCVDLFDGLRQVRIENAKKVDVDGASLSAVVFGR